MDSARRSEPGPDPGWCDARQAVIRAAEACTAAMASLSLHGGRGPAMAVASEAADVLRDIREMLRGIMVDDAAIEVEAARRAAEILACAGPPPRRRRHLHVVS